MSSLAGVSNRSTPHSLAFHNDSCCWNFLANSLPFPKYRCETCFQQMQCLLSSVPMAMIMKTKMGMGCDFNRYDEDVDGVNDEVDSKHDDKDGDAVWFHLILSMMIY